MTISEMKAKIATNYSAFKAMVEMISLGYNEETAIASVYRIWFN